MRILFILVFIKSSVFVWGQRIEFRNDSLFVNSSYVNRNTTKSTLDSLLNTKGKTKERKGKFKPGTTERMNIVSYAYKNTGIIFNKNDYDTAQLSIAVKLHKNSNESVDQSNLPVKPFKGELYIDVNYMNDKRSIEQLQKLESCTVSYSETTLMSHTGITNCKIHYQKRGITVLFDFAKNAATCIFIN